MLADGEHAQPAERAAVRMLQEPHRRRHVAVLEPDPHHATGCSIATRGFFYRDEFAAVGDGRAQRFFDEHMGPVAQQRLDHSAVRVIGARDHRYVEVTVGHERFDVGILAWCARCQHGSRRCATGLVRVAQRHHLGVGQAAQRMQVLDAHHAAADDCIAQHARRSNAVRHGVKGRRE